MFPGLPRNHSNAGEKETTVTKATGCFTQSWISPESCQPKDSAAVFMSSPAAVNPGIKDPDCKSEKCQESTTLTSQPVAAQKKRKICLCNFCGASFSSNSGLYEHVNYRHLKKYPYTCPACRRGIGRKENYMDHVNWHSGIKAHKCPNCSSVFSFKTCLRKHLRVGVCNKNPDRSSPNS